MTTHVQMNAAQPLPHNDASDQSEVIALLSDPASYGEAVTAVEVIETHGAMVFLAGTKAVKIKRAVKFPYMNYSTLARRGEMCRREFELNHRWAHEIYERVVPVVRESGGRLRLDGAGDTVEWALVMHRFDQDCLVSSIAARGELDDGLIRKLAAAVKSSHNRAEHFRQVDGPASIAAIIEELTAAFADAGDILGKHAVEAFSRPAMRELNACRDHLARRADICLIKRCHGDLHLDNIVVLDGEPVLFDAVEFNDAIAIIDVLYDLAFLIMDLDHRGMRAQANLLLNRYFYEYYGEPDASGYTALPLFLACRAGVRAMVELQRGRQSGCRDAAAHLDAARRYFQHTLDYLQTECPRLVAVGGFSGSGKSTLSAALGPLFGNAPGATHLRSDLERKMMCHAAEMERLDDSFYTPEANTQVYDRLFKKAGILLRAGRSVVADAVFAEPHEREAIERVAQGAGVAFQGLWLSAPADTMRHRADKRTDDVSDATSRTIDTQIAKGAGNVAWTTVEAGGSPDDTLRNACCVLSFRQCR
jgi:hypothetical protein